MKDCVVTAAVLLQLEDVIDSIENDNITPDSDVFRTVNQLVRCGNLVLSEIAAEYIPLKTCEQLEAVDKKIEYVNFSKKAVDIFKVSFRGKPVKFKLFYDSFSVPYAGVYEVEYSYEPLGLALGGETDYSSGRLSARCVAYGIACEYCLISGMTEEAVLWDKRYKDSLFAASIVKNERNVKARVWA